MKLAGAVLLHGFTGSPDTMRSLVPYLDRIGLRHDLPTLRGHGSHPRDLEGVTWQDWIEDATHALLRMTPHEPAVLVGLSFGGLLALHLAALFPMRVAGVVTLGAALRLRNPLVYLHPLLPLVARDYPTTPHYLDAEAARTDNNYRSFPTRTFHQVYRYAHLVRRELSQVRCPLLIVQSSIDSTVQPESAVRIYREVASRDKQVVWFDRSDHELLRDAEKDAVCRRIVSFIERLEVKAHVPA